MVETSNECLVVSCLSFQWELEFAFSIWTGLPMSIKRVFRCVCSLYRLLSVFSIAHRHEDHSPLKPGQGNYRSYYFTLRVLQYSSRDKEHVIAEGTAFQIVKYYDSNGDNPPNPVLK